MTLNSVAVSALLLACALPVRAQQPDVKETTALLGKSFAELSGWILKAAEMVPADEYSYKAAPTVRTFAELLGHIADEQDAAQKRGDQGQPQEGRREETVGAVREPPLHDLLAER